MAIFAVTFRIADETTLLGSYRERWTSVDEAIKASTTGTYWNETTSFYLIQSSTNSTDLAREINNASNLDVERDLLVCINLSQKGYKTLGKYEDGDIDALMKLR
ncbi:hypothetical protein BMJ34_20835 [Sinorhizobium medicae]|uniref:hypothetical protein n=1 Tax=Sinorhizobium medicae TaxID=110321 RepID=UPI000C7C2E4C|nr:hypothetical protein [Sinorhizobium medicae]PLT95485.1 hypothetical protein BMJ34_20835 [Sinorhizobium medicae]PLU12405.1 hypothetical protein BMJ30_27745 [Sinorhizobium medicae]PLU26083.1 hypothetical protein BMJ27_34665 [Sinorhizobium medicae]